MNKVMYGENRRRGGRNTLCRLLRSGRWFLCLALLCSAILPGFAGAADKNECTDWNGASSVIYLQLPDSVSFEPGKEFQPYISPPTTVKYKCSFTLFPNPDKQHQVALTKLADLGPLTGALKNAGMKMELMITDSSGVSSSWTFSGTDPASALQDHVNIGSTYPVLPGDTDRTTGDRTLTIRTKLSREKGYNLPGFYVIPPLSSFKLVPYYGTFSGGIPLNTPPIRLQYVPTCFVQSSLPTNNISFGPVLTTDADNSLSRKIPFTVTANVNRSCNSGLFGNLLTGYKPSLAGAQTYYLNLPLKVSFILNNGGVISADNKSIILHKKGTETENGLQLKITDGSGAPVTFGEISTTGSIPPPANQFGKFQGSDSGGTWNISNTYHAVLSSTGKPVITGSYSAQVTVKVEYY
ncbi:hypothetical protein D9P64_08970 [Salmonella enterica subsp. enterica serovar Kibi]|uniref:Fimbrial-type adhesion domain-containing protein n=1 Tax=Salmonella enterica subsp. enterica serovar Cardoner TaxID=2564309 RepID=A0A5V6Q212_SALET|nr:hypothetical protein [Salmonella enterica]EBU8205968.1 hypothetical protein [Salmonella enterica subsp. enterica serovar Cardoner]EBZ2860455.1 hypothetical protein [Salmonella enterica subsp. enterica serovar Kibi]ECE8654934.1 hypothetical protein [Salmonella enterica subsp. enterica]EBM1965362.1 hypothetical protein [Salmonella enterica]